MQQVLWLNEAVKQTDSVSLSCSPKSVFALWITGHREHHLSASPTT